MDFNGHAGDIAGLSLSPDMKTYITGSVDKTAKLWDVREQGHKQMFFGHDMDVSSVCVSLSTPYAFNLICINLQLSARSISVSSKWLWLRLLFGRSNGTLVRLTS